MRGGVVVATMPSKWVAHCHCTRCRLAHAAAFVTWVGMDASRVALHDDRQYLRWYRHEGGGERGFCSCCGSSLFFRSDAWPGELHVARAVFLQPIDREPQMHGYHDTHVSWVQLGDALPRKPDPAAPAA